jgi:uncharacterized membrane protein
MAADRFMLDLVMSILASMAVMNSLVSMAMRLVTIAVRFVNMAVRFVSMAMGLVILDMSRMTLFPSMLLGSKTNGKTSAKTKLQANSRGQTN